MLEDKNSDHASRAESPRISTESKLDLPLTPVEITCHPLLDRLAVDVERVHGSRDWKGALGFRTGDGSVEVLDGATEVLLKGAKAC